MKTLQIDFVSDVVCPWCALGLASFDRAAQQLRDELTLEVRFQPFELNPQMAPEGEDVDEHLQRKYGRPKEAFEAARTTLRERGAAVGFIFGERTRIWNTFDAHRLLHWAGLQGASQQHALKRAVLRAYHGEGRNPSDPAVLEALAAGVGLDAQQAREVLHGETYATEVRAAEAHWQGLGIQAVPAVVINGRHLVSGGQPPEVYEQALRQIAASAAEA